MAAAFLLSAYLSFCLQLAAAQSISTSTPLPPLQWINLSPFLQGSTAPPPLKDVALGYDESSRTLVVFGGESEGGFVQSQTYLLDMNTLAWSIPSPPANLDRTPPGRSSAISGVDIAASNRHAFVVIGGKGPNDVALSDVWAFDFTNRFWSEIQPTHAGPSARWGASGGIDIRTSPIQDPVLPGPNNTLYISGGFDGKTIYPLSDVWRLIISGILSANLPNDVQATWEKVPVDGTLPGSIRQGGTIMGQQIVSAGGCKSVENHENSSCAVQDSYVVDVQRRSSIAPGPCAAPRLDPVLAPNFNTYSTNFASQVFLALGTYNSTLWSDGNGLSRGEVDVLDVNTGSWSRIIPAGDPDSTGKQAYPTPREGASSFSYDRALVGAARNGISDTIIYGGRDESGRYLSEMWILRSYRDSLTSSGSHWTGYGNGKVQTGPDANGAGVTIQYMTECASAKEPPPNPGHGSGNPVETQPPSVSLTADTGFAHKLLSPLSLALLLLSFILLRAFPFSLPISPNPTQTGAVPLLVSTIIVGAYAIGIAGCALSFTSLNAPNVGDSSPGLSPKHLSTLHSRAALAFSVCLYIAVPLLLLAFVVLQRVRSIAAADAGSGMTELQRTMSSSTGEKLNGGDVTPGTPSINGLYSPHLYSPPASPSPRPRTQSYTMPRRSHEGMSTDGEESSMSTPPTRGFVVLNRPRGRMSQPPTGDTLRPPSQTMPPSRNLGEIDWLLRRRSLNAVGDLDYALTLAHNAQRNSAAAETTFPPSSHQNIGIIDTPSNLIIAAYTLTQLGFLGLTIVTLIALWNHAHRALFAVFLVYAVVFYLLAIFIPRRFPTEQYLLSLLPSSGHTHVNLGKDPAEPNATASPPTFPSQAGHHSPYLHTPPFTTVRMDSSPAGRPMSMATDDDDDDDIDDDTRQRMIEEEMSRRDVSIITMPKRKLTVANPS
ncbi:hypothetical protein NMY22_g16213 [Coprinellus aureogranulatus]|nr:hypothetical protein NMY22_g16213 [Coprinellus aureogranulatus]